MADQIFVQHRFTIVDKNTGISFSDAIVLPVEEYDALSDKQIEKKKQERFDNWKEVISNPPDPVEVPVEEKIDAIEKQIQELTEQKEQLEQEVE